MVTCGWWGDIVMANNILVNKGGIWTATKPQANKGLVWTASKEGWVNKNGIWTKAYASAISYSITSTHSEGYPNKSERIFTINFSEPLLVQPTDGFHVTWSSPHGSGWPKWLVIYCDFSDHVENEYYNAKTEVASPTISRTLGQSPQGGQQIADPVHLTQFIIDCHYDSATTVTIQESELTQADLTVNGIVYDLRQNGEIQI